MTPHCCLIERAIRLARMLRRTQARLDKLKELRQSAVELGA